jgi:hypothetical protein
LSDAGAPGASPTATCCAATWCTAPAVTTLRRTVAADRFRMFAACVACISAVFFLHVVNAPMLDDDDRGCWIRGLNLEQKTISNKPADGS